MTVQTFRKKPTEVQALQWRGDNADEVVAFAGHDFEAFTEPCDDDPEATAALMSAPHSTWELVYTGDWIVRHGGGLFTCWRDDEFRETFDPVTPAAPAGPGCDCVACRSLRGDAEANSIVDGILNGPRSEPASDEVSR